MTEPKFEQLSFLYHTGSVGIWLPSVGELHGNTKNGAATVAQRDGQTNCGGVGKTWFKGKLW